MPEEIDLLFCPCCRHEVFAEAPPCADGHDTCPDRACIVCGTALVVDAPMFELIVSHNESLAGKQAPRDSHAA